MHRHAARHARTLSRWRQLIIARLERWESEERAESPMPPRVLATLIGNLFERAETEILAGVPESTAHQVEALDACAELVERAERRRRLVDH